MTCLTIRNILRTSGCSTVTSLSVCVINLGLPVLIIAMPFCRSWIRTMVILVNSRTLIENASFLRLKNVVLGYTLPKSVLSKVGIQNLRLYVQAENLLTITGYSGLDPEYTNADMGKESGGDLQRGVDMGGWPSTMRFLFGVNFAF